MIATTCHHPIPPTYRITYRVFPYNISNRTIIPCQHFFPTVFQTVPSYHFHIVYQTVSSCNTNSIPNRTIIPYQHTQEHASERRATRAERQVHKSIHLQGYTAVLTPQVHKNTHCIDIILLHQHHKYTRVCHRSLEVILLYQNACWGSLRI